MGGPRIGWAYAGASVLCVVTLLALSNPLGVWIRTWPWAVRGVHGWSRESATVSVLGACTLALAAGAFLAPGRARAVGMLLPVWIGVCFLTNTTTRIDKSGTLGVKANLFGAAFFVAPLLAGAIGGGFWSSLARGRDRAGRAVVALSSALLAAILLYPQYQPPGLAGLEDAPTYFSPLADLVSDLLDSGSPPLSGPRLLVAVVTLLYAAVALVGIAGAVFWPRRSLAVPGILLFLSTLVFPMVYALILEWNAGNFEPSWQMGLQTGAEQAFNFHMASALGLFACTADLIRGGGGVPPAPGSAKPC